MQKFKFFLPFLAVCFLITSCEKQVELTVIEVDSALDLAYRYAIGTDAEHQADHINDYINNCNDAEFVNTINNTNEAMIMSGFDYLDASKVYTYDDVLFYPILRSSEQNSGFLNLCMPFYRTDQSSQEPILLMEGPGVTAIGILTDLFNDGQGGGRGGGGDITPIVAINPGGGSFGSGYSTSYRTKNGQVNIDYERNRNVERQGILHIVVESTNDAANIDQSWLINY